MKRAMKRRTGISSLHHILSLNNYTLAQFSKMISSFRRYSMVSHREQCGTVKPRAVLQETKEL